MLIPLSGAIAPLLDLAIGLGVLLILMLAYGLTPSWHIVAVIPLALVAGLLALAVSLWLGPINVRFRDVKHTVPFIIQIWMYASPVVYPLRYRARAMAMLYALNPWSASSRASAGPSSPGRPDLTGDGRRLFSSSCCLLGGLVFFRRNDNSFADLI